MPSDTRQSDPAGDDEAPGLTRLPGGRHGLPREFVVHNQRERLIAGLAQAVSQRGFADATIADITSNAGVSRRTFYEHFASKEECFLAAYDLVLDHLRSRMTEAASERSTWGEQVVAAVNAALQLLADEPEFARLATLEAVVAGKAGAERYRQSLDELVPFLKRGRDEAPGAYPLPPSTEDALIGGVASLIAREINAGRARELPALAPEVVNVLLLPYLGAGEAERLAQSAS